MDIRTCMGRVRDAEYLMTAAAARSARRTSVAAKSGVRFDSVAG